MLELGHLPLPVDGFIAQAWKQPFESLSQSGHYGVLRGSGCESFQDRVETETGIGPDADLSNIRRHVDETGPINSTLPSHVLALPARSSVSHIGRVGLD